MQHKVQPFRTYEGRHRVVRRLNSNRRARYTERVSVLWDLRDAAMLRAWEAYDVLRARRNNRVPTAAELTEHPLTAAALRDHATHELLPFWERYATDKKHGGFLTHLEADGTPYDTRKVSAMQARMMYAFAAGFEFEPHQRYKQAASNALAFMRSHMYDRKRGGWYSATDRAGATEEDTKRTFDQAYTIVGLAQYARVFDDHSALDDAARTFDVVDERAWDAARGGYFESCAADWTTVSERKTICVQLDMLYACISLYEAGGDQRYLRRAEEIANLIVAHLIDVRHGCVLEIARANWRYDSFATRDIVWTGHNLKAAWLLLQLSGLVREVRYAAAAHMILDYCLQFAWDAIHSGFFHYMFRNGRIASLEKVWWTNCEGIMMLLLAGMQWERSDYIELAQRLWSFCRSFYFDEQHGEWYYSVRPDGRPLSDRKGGNAKAAYHTVQMCLYGSRYLATSATSISSGTAFSASLG